MSIQLGRRLSNAWKAFFETGFHGEVLIYESPTSTQRVFNQLNTVAHQYISLGEQAEGVSITHRMRDMAIGEQIRKEQEARRKEIADATPLAKNNNKKGATL